MKTKCFNLVRHSDRLCADGKCEAELIQRPAESNYDFSRRIYCGACEKIKRKARHEAPAARHAVAEAVPRHPSVLEYCNTPVEERSHPQPSKRNPSGYWYARWLLCPRCHAMYMLESEKMGYDGLPFKESDHKQRWNRATVAPQPPTMSRWSPLDCGAGNDPRDVPWNE